tara:strand:+ start:131 stop:337 length:207 start_codon:yes stop_codon:yes gene_type:complete
VRESEYKFRAVNENAADGKIMCAREVAGRNKIAEEDLKFITSVLQSSDNPVRHHDTIHHREQTGPELG